MAARPALVSQLPRPYSRLPSRTGLKGFRLMPSSEAVSMWASSTSVGPPGSPSKPRDDVRDAPQKPSGIHKAENACGSIDPTYSATAPSPGPPGYAGFTLLIETRSARVANSDSGSRMRFRSMR